MEILGLGSGILGLPGRGSGFLEPLGVGSGLLGFLGWIWLPGASFPGRGSGFLEPLGLDSGPAEVPCYQRPSVAPGTC